ncbi:acyltransferase family protein [Plantibacter cousiniae (nom. nud.)]|uniref:acyltransferase family protein n=1 Tax=Plantibacter cousiniae (nom. nud.) TaxID=199709 RepID=UPI001E611F7C|nr:acyltransferase family protein [Plantibacter cousiniae]
MTASMSLRRNARSRAAAATPPLSSFRPDIQGLRAFAVVVVILDHLFAWPSGGFLGVDVFFVISGFIISSLLLRQIDKHGRIDFRGFYRKRAKRILPASTLVLTVTVLASFLIYNVSKAQGVLTDGIASLFFVANWRFASTGTDYWAAEGTSPLQHYWSLGVEEQFYFVWPVILTAVALVTAAIGTRSRRVVIGVTLSLLVLASLGWALFETATNGAWAYFSTATRAWELGFGALIAVCAPLLVRIPSVMRPYLAWLGILTMIAGVALLNSESPIPAPGALVPVLGTALVIAAGTGGRAAFLWPLTNRVTRYVGDISYSLYLWHFPLIVLLAPLFDDPIKYSVIVLILTVALSVTSYHFVENPLRTSGWLEPAARKRQLKAERRAARDETRQRWTYGLFGAIATYALISVTILIWPAQPATSAEPRVISFGEPVATSTAATEAMPAQADLGARIDAALAASEWPELTPSIATILTDGAPIEDSAGCSRTVVADPTSCAFPNEGATKEAVVLGDSTGITLLPLVREGLGGDYNVRGLTMAACVPFDVSTTFDDANDASACEQHRAAALTEITAQSPDVVFITAMYGYINSLASGATGSAAELEWRQGTESLVAQLQASGAQVVIVSSPPLGKALTDCATNFSSPRDCVAEITSTYDDVNSIYRSVAQTAGADYIDTKSWFCSDDGLCPSFVDGVAVKRDKVHTTPQYSALLVPVFVEIWASILHG